MNFILFFLLLNPSITFGLIEAEVFPYAIFFALFFVKKIYKPIFVIFVYITIIGFISILYNDTFPKDLLRSYLAFINPLFAVLLIYSNENLRNSIIRYSKPYFYFLLFLGLVQYFNLIPFFDIFLKFIVPRSSASALEESGRGVTLLSTEPARAGIELLFLFALINLTNKFSKYKILIEIFFLLYVILILKSATVLFMTLLYFGIIYFNFKKLFLYASFIFLLIFFSLNTNTVSRSATLIRDLSNLPLEEQYFLLVNTSGNRLISILTFYPYAFKKLIGGGIGNWLISSMEALKFAKINPSDYNFFKYDYNLGMRGSGYFTNLALDTGIIGLIPVVYFVFKSLKTKFIDDRYSIAFLFIFIFSLFFIGSVGTTTTWVLFYTFIFFKKHNAKQIRLQ